MPPVCVVEAFNEIDDRIAGVVVIPEGRPIDQFALECGEEALAHGVVVAITDRTHGRPSPARTARATTECAAAATFATSQRGTDCPAVRSIAP